MLACIAWDGQRACGAPVRRIPTHDAVTCGRHTVTGLDVHRYLPLRRAVIV